MSGPQNPSATRPVSVAELLAKNGTIGAPPVTGRRRRRRGNSDAVTVAELTGEIPVITDEDHRPQTEPLTAHPGPATLPRRGRRANGATKVAEPVPVPVPEPVAEPVPEPIVEAAPDELDEHEGKTAFWSEPEPRWPQSPPQPRRERGPELSQYPRPLRRVDRSDAERPNGAESRSGAERMSPDPIDDYAGIPVDVMDTEVREAEPAAIEDSAYVRSYLGGAEGSSDGTAVAGDTAAGRVSDEPAGSERDGALFDDEELAEDYEHFEDHFEEDVDQDFAPDVDDSYAWSSRTELLLHGGLVIFQSILAVAFGAGLFIAFDQLWQWNNIVALVLAVLVILSLVAGVQVVRKTVDTASTLIAVAVGALIAFGPLVLLQSG